MYLVEGVSKEERSRQGLPFYDAAQVETGFRNLEDWLRETGIKAVVRSTSESVQEPNVEQMAAVAAGRAGIPVFVVEDFPGNYLPSPDERLDGLFVEDESVAALHRARSVDPKAIFITGNPRYTSLATVNRESTRMRAREELDLGDARAVLWAGQPDGDNSFLALGRLLEGYADGRFTLLFRAHPRDQLYASGRYDELWHRTSINVRDLSSHPDVLDLYGASDLVMTQFSSAAVEASYLGVPALFALFDDLGKQYLRTFKGYESLPWSHNGCAFLIEREDQIPNVMESAIFDDSARERVAANFRRHFSARRDCAEEIANHIRAAIGEATLEPSRPVSLT